MWGQLLESLNRKSHTCPEECDSKEKKKEKDWEQKREVWPIIMQKCQTYYFTIVIIIMNIYAKSQ